MVVSNGAGPAGMVRCTSISPSRLKRPRDHGAGVQVNATITRVRWGGEAPEVSSA